MKKEDLVRFRKRHNLERKELARLLDVDRTYIGLLETGTRPISNSIRYKFEKLEEELSTTGIEKLLHTSSNADKILTKVKEEGVSYGQHKVIPYFDVDVMATPIEVFNDQSTSPAYKIDMPGFSDCDFAINVYGHSMYPTIESGMIVLCKKLEDKSLIAFGEIYFIVTKDLRLVKRILRSEKRGYIIASSDNHNGHSDPDGKRFAPMEIPIDKILHIYMVKGSFKRHLI